MAPIDTNEPYRTDDLIYDQEYPFHEQERGMDADRGGFY
jgi:hypothetical protein